MEEKYLVSLQEIKFAIESEGGMDIGDFNYDTLVDILELIDNQQKEIEEIRREELNTIISCIDKHYISKNKIKEIIEKHYPDVAITKLQELLEE